MTRGEKYKIKQNTKYGNLFWDIGAAPGARMIFIGIYIAGAVYVAIRSSAVASAAAKTPMLSPLVEWVMTHSVLAYLLFGGVALLVLMVYPFGRKSTEEALKTIGLVNRAELAPFLLRKETDKENPRVTIWTFRNNKIPLKAWEDKRAAIETALGVTIVSMKYAEGNQRILLHTVPAESDLPDLLPWRDKYISPKSFVLVLGQSYTGSVTVNLASIPHVLLGGSTGSGKSVLLKVLILQALKKGAYVAIADFKGGVDFPPAWRQKCRMCYDEQALVELLDIYIAALESRKELFRDAGVPNLDEYNRATGEHMPRYILACDKIAEVLDTTGHSKEQKALVAQIEIRLSIIARLGRAFGIHLILATQRPDANILSGQIKNNIDCRVCGRADSVLSQIILGKTDADEQIPKDAKGRFLLHDGTLFQGFWLDEADL